MILAVDARPKSPMPPVNMLHAVNISSERWRDSDDLTGLRQYISTLLTSNGNGITQMEKLLAQGYENLQACLPR